MNKREFDFLIAKSKYIFCEESNLTTLDYSDINAMFEGSTQGAIESTELGYFKDGVIDKPEFPVKNMVLKIESPEGLEVDVVMGISEHAKRLYKPTGQIIFTTVIKDTEFGATEITVLLVD